MSEGVRLAPRTLPGRSPWTNQEHPWRQLVGWLAGSVVAGIAIGAVINVILWTIDRRPNFYFFQVSLLFSMFVATAAFACSRSLLPLLARSHPILRYAATITALVGSAFLATLLSLGFRVGVLFNSEDRPFFLTVVLANLILSLLVGGALITWDGMRRSLARAYEQLRVKEVMDREMELAREVQEEMLPKSAPDIQGLDFAFTNKPARQVGGDTLDFVPLPDGRWALAVGDVVGKGMAAALMMANLQALVRAVASVEPDPGRLNAIVSEVIGSRVRAGRFVTLAYMVYDPRTGALNYSLAGHHPPMIVGTGGVRLLERGGLPLGLFPGLPYDQGTDCLAVGESMVLYTDGLIEAGAGGDEEQQFGHQKLKDICARCHSDGPEALLNTIVAALESHLDGAPPADDTTILVVRRRELET
ncbi:MAG: PP2C family protein-serine/threonine phosphatase [Acidobacteriota bacterium]